MVEIEDSKKGKGGTESARVLREVIDGFNDGSLTEKQAADKWNSFVKAGRDAFGEGAQIGLENFVFNRSSNPDFVQTLPRGLDFSNANLRGADLSRTSISEANFSGSDLSYATASSISLCSSNVSDVIFAKAELTNCNFEGSDLRSADFTEAVLNGQINLKGANLNDSQLVGIKTDSKKDLVIETDGSTKVDRVMADAETLNLVPKNFREALDSAPKPKEQEEIGPRFPTTDTITPKESRRSTAIAALTEDDTPSRFTTTTTVSAGRGTSDINFSQVKHPSADMVESYPQVVATGADLNTYVKLNKSYETNSFSLKNTMQYRLSDKFALASVLDFEKQNGTATEKSRYGTTSTFEKESFSAALHTRFDATTSLSFTGGLGFTDNKYSLSGIDANRFNGYGGSGQEMRIHRIDANYNTGVLNSQSYSVELGANYRSDKHTQIGVSLSKPFATNASSEHYSIGEFTRYSAQVSQGFFDGKLDLGVKLMAELGTALGASVHDVTPQSFSQNTTLIQGTIGFNVGGDGKPKKTPQIH